MRNPRPSSREPAQPPRWVRDRDDEGRGQPAVRIGRLRGRFVPKGPKRAQVRDQVARRVGPKQSQARAADIARFRHTGLLRFLNNAYALTRTRNFCSRRATTRKWPGSDLSCDVSPFARRLTQTAHEESVRHSQDGKIRLMGECGKHRK